MTASPNTRIWTCASLSGNIFTQNMLRQSPVAVDFLPPPAWLPLLTTLMPSKRWGDVTHMTEQGWHSSSRA